MTTIEQVQEMEKTNILESRASLNSTGLNEENMLTIDQLRKVIPKKFHRGLNKETLENIVNIMNDPVHYETFRENFLSYTGVLNEGRFSLLQYTNAVKYVSFKLMGNTNIEAYVRTFPDRYQRLVDKGIPDKDIASHITSYNKSKLVNLILEQSLVPSWVLNQDLYQKALNVQAELMMNPNVSPKVRTDAANSLLTHLKKPDSNKVDINIGIREDSTITSLRETTLELVAQQKQLLQKGLVDAQEVAHSRIIPEVEDVDFKES